ncbi:hypothetical protein [Gracilimonas mengyeensis]|uniref:ABC-2 family transporter protein n=1 Tax=Gracilimonas mengyeensis TaxID=1302730 RepID=A0A521DBY5_9BACT|nr:hypothetical protein [Gracilimonas mengyeensis]SMO69219.1 hypothetical protein SAMN06265219_10822 [Gracilimonas mengyeensis]
MKNRLWTYLIPLLIAMMYVIVIFIDAEELYTYDFLRAIYIVSTTTPILYIFSINREKDYRYQSQRRFQNFPVAPRDLLKEELRHTLRDPHFLVPVLLCLAAITWTSLATEVETLYVMAIQVLYCLLMLLLLVVANTIKYRYEEQFKNVIIVAFFAIMLQLDITYLVDESILHIIYALMPNSAFLMVLFGAPIVQALALCSIIVSLYGTYFLWRKELRYINK